MDSPSIEDTDDGKQVYDVETSSRKVQRIFAAYNLYGTFRSRLDSVVVNFNTVREGDVTKYKFCFAKVLGLVELNLTHETPRKRDMYGTCKT